MNDRFVTCDHPFHDHKSLEEARACPTVREFNDPIREQAAFEREVRRFDDYDDGILAEDDR